MEQWSAAHSNAIFASCKLYSRVAKSDRDHTDPAPAFAARSTPGVVGLPSGFNLH